MIKINNLTCGYDLKFFLEDINLNIHNKEIVGIIGPNGSGKTTLLRAITKVLKPKKGRILFQDRDIWHINPRELARGVAVVSQTIEAEIMTVEEFILLGRIPHYKRFQLIDTKKDLDAAERAMALTNISKLKDQPMNQISGGERQLALIARALTQEPRLLLLDEPTAHLDITHQVGVLDLIKRLNRDFGLTVIMVLHDLNLASEYCHRLALLNKGRVHKIGKTEEVIDYKTIEEVYKTVVVVEKNPVSSKPHIFAVPEEERQRKKEDNAYKPDSQRK